MDATRSPQEVFGHHAEALGAEDAVFITPEGVRRVEDGIDAFVFRDGLIRVQTVRYTLRPAG
jgi:hypothetical protein